MRRRCHCLTKLRNVPRRVLRQRDEAAAVLRVPVELTSIDVRANERVYYCDVHTHRSYNKLLFYIPKENHGNWFAYGYNV